MYGYFKLKDIDIQHPMYLYYGTFGTRNIREGAKFYFNGRHYTYKDVMQVYNKGIQDSIELLNKKFNDPTVREEQISFFNSLIRNSDLKYTLEFGTLVDVSVVIREYCEKETGTLANSNVLDSLMRGLRVATWIAFACACVSVVIEDETITDNEKQMRIDSIMEDFEHVQKRLQL